MTGDNNSSVTPKYFGICLGDKYSRRHDAEKTHQLHFGHTATVAAVNVVVDVIVVAADASASTVLGDEDGGGGDDDGTDDGGGGDDDGGDDDIDCVEGGSNDDVDYNGEKEDFDDDVSSLMIEIR